MKGTSEADETTQMTVFVVGIRRDDEATGHTSSPPRVRRDERDDENIASRVVIVASRSVRVRRKYTHVVSVCLSESRAFASRRRTLSSYFIFCEKRRFAATRVGDAHSDRREPRGEMRGGGDVIFLATRPPPAAPLPRGSRPRGRGRGAPRGSRRGDDRSPKGRRRWDARRGARAPGVPPAASDRHVTASAARSSLPAASSRYEPGGDDAPGTWADALSVMADTLRDLGSLRTPHLGSSRPLDPASDAVRVVHPLSEHGARRAVFVGVNYAPFVSGGEKHRRRASSSVRLRHREDDCRWMLETLAPRGFDDPDGARVLVDDGHEDGQPTWANITRAMAWLTRRAQPGDSLAFHFSGRTDLRREDDASGTRRRKKRDEKKAPDGLTATTAVGPSASRTTASFEPTPRFYRATGKKRARSRARSCTRVW